MSRATSFTKLEAEEIKRHASVLRVYGGRLKGMHKKGSGYIAHCPFHNDKNPSFQINQKGNVWLWHCFPCQARGGSGGSGGSIIDFVMKKDGLDQGSAIKKIAAELGILPKSEEEPESQPRQPFKYDPAEAKNNLPRIEGYLSERGISLEVARQYDIGAVDVPGLGLGVAMPYGNSGAAKIRSVSEKKFIQPTGIPSNKLLFGIDHLDWIRLLTSGGWVFVTESELDALTLISAGFLAVSVSTATVVKDRTLTIEPKDLEELNQADHIFLALDMDSDGQKCADALQRALPNTKTHRLTWDYIKGVMGPKDIGEIYTKSPAKFKETIEALAAESLRFRSVGDLRYELCGLPAYLDKEIAVPKELLGPVIREKYLIEIYAARGLGKTYVSLGIALSIATGAKFLKWQPAEPQPVLYIDGEMSGHDFQSRLKDLCRGLGDNVDPSRFYPMNFDSMTNGPSPDIAKSEGREAIDDMLNVTGAKVLVLDNLSCLALIPDNDDEKWLPIGVWLVNLRKRGITVMIVHHAGKNGDQRGISRRDDPLNAVIKLSKPDGWRPDEGLHCKMSFTKTRSNYGKDGAPLDIRLITDEHGGLTWAWVPAEVGRIEQFREMSEAGMTQKAICDTMNISRATFYNYQKKVQAEAKPELDLVESNQLV